MLFTKNKSAQMQMMETIGVLFIFFVLVLFGIIFYFKFQQISLEQKEEELLAADAMDITLTALFMPEFQCSRGTAEAEDNCVDMSKLRALNGTMPDYINDYYFNLFGFSKIYVTSVYPGNQTYVLYDKEKVSTNSEGEEVSSWQLKESTYFVVTLKDETQARMTNSSILGSSSSSVVSRFTFPTVNSKGVYGVGYMGVEVYS